MNIRCPRCQTLYRVDPDRIPAGGVRARCSRCGETFPVRRSDPIAAPVAVPEAPTASVPAAPREEPAVASPPEMPARTPVAPAPDPAPIAGDAPSVAAQSSAEPTRPASQDGPQPGVRAPAFGFADPHARARRIARALVSDIVAYHPERRDRSLADGTLKTELREEVLKSWEEYVAQVGPEIARDTSYFRDALNEILAKGQPVF